MTDLSQLHPDMQRRVVVAVAKATEGPSFLRRVKGWSDLPAVERYAITKRLGDGGWRWGVDGCDLVLIGSVA